MSKTSAYQAYLIMQEEHGNLTGISLAQQAKWLVEVIKTRVVLEPAYLNELPESFWEHKLETREIEIMR
jgi:hypothetical protein